MVVRVGVVIGKMIGGGVESVVMNYYRHIDRSQIQFDFICDEDSTDIPRKEIEDLGGQVILVPPYQKIGSYSKELYRIFKENKYKIVHSHINTLSVFPLSVAKLARVPIRIAHSHSTTNNSEMLKNLLKLILRPTAKWSANEYFTCSILAGKWLFGESTYDSGNVFLMNNAIDVEKFKFNANQRAEKRKELDIGENTLVIGHIGRFVEQKNHKFLLEIFAELIKLKPDAILILAGQGPLENDICKKIKSLGIESSVKLLGQVSDVTFLYQTIDVFLLPSLYEGLPVVGVESQASGVLTVLSTAITEETKIIDSTFFMSLEESPEIWANQIYKSVNGIYRKDVSEEVRDNHFDIKYEANLLTEKYLSLLGKID
ncbi:glycosyltransferase family 1 protein [Streptococcus sp. 121]|uniref:glycosyltransferase family 1 protein n=1 Tax=Streptococcus sp. 121 TaxID=2797637 RepID=UPI0018F06972|nr:glycosyltransferase family 1 protein [Streptococcus sp. 121]MBJ6746077.1 glycosyltransferase family 1 protein [Streptococcus sp. 121]